MSLIFIEIKNWADFQEREDRPNYVWFKFANGYFSDRKLRTISFRARISFIYLLCERSKSSKPFAEVNVEYAAFELHLSQADFVKDIEDLELLGVISRLDAGSLPVNSGKMSTDYRLDKRRKEKNRKEKKSGEKKSRRGRKTIEAIQELKPLESLFVEKQIGEKTQKAWLEAYPDAAWIVSECRKAAAWESSDPKNHRPRFGAFIANWLARGWDSRKQPKPAAKLLTTTEELREAGLL